MITIWESNDHENDEVITQYHTRIIDSIQWRNEEHTMNSATMCMAYRSAFNFTHTILLPPIDMPQTLGSL